MNAALLLVLAVILVPAAYMLACWVWPYAACWRCHGDGKHRSPSGKAWRTCKKCRGTGARLRIGRHLWNTWSETARRSTQ